MRPILEIGARESCFGARGSGLAFLEDLETQSRTSCISQGPAQGQGKWLFGSDRNSSSVYRLGEAGNSRLVARNPQTRDRRQEAGGRPGAVEDKTLHG
jgi:hypothetical protein